MFLSLFCSPRLHLFDSKYKYIKNSNTVIFIWFNFLHFKITIFYLNIILNAIYSCDAKLNFQHHYSSLQCHMILQKSFQYADLQLKKHLLLLSMSKTVFQYSLMNRNLAEIERFCNIINVFTVTFWSSQGRLSTGKMILWGIICFCHCYPLLAVFLWLGVLCIHTFMYIQKSNVWCFYRIAIAIAI